MNREMWLYWIGFCLGLVNFVQAQTCTPVDQCSCKFPNGSVITLWGIDQRYTIGTFAKTFTYLYSPCTGLNEPHSDCDGTLGCQVGSNIKTPIAYKPKLVKVDKNAPTGLYEFMYTGAMDKSSKQKFTLTILLRCTEDQKPSFTKMLNCDSCSFEIFSKCACPGRCSIPKPSPAKSTKKFSTGSLLCILLLVFVVVYLIVGIAINKFALHKEGSDVIPQKSIWIDMPSLVKDGCIFTYQKMRKGKGDYQQI